MPRPLLKYALITLCAVVLVGVLSVNCGIGLPSLLVTVTWWGALLWLAGRALWRRFARTRRAD